MSLKRVLCGIAFAGMAAASLAAFGQQTTPPDQPVYYTTPPAAVVVPPANVATTPSGTAARKRGMAVSKAPVIPSGRTARRANEERNERLSEFALTRPSATLSQGERASARVSPSPSGRRWPKAG